MPGKKKTASDLCKAILSAHPDGGGLAREWKRVARHAGPGATTVREFENARLGRRLAVTEYPEGRFEVSAAAPRADGRDLQPAIDTAPAANAAADEAMRLFLDGGWDDLDSAGQNQLIATAGRALANRFCFALSEMWEAGEGYWFISPRAYWEKEHACLDHDAPFLCFLLPPGMSNAMEACWEGSGGAPLDEARELLARGFVWDPAFQHMIAASDGERSDLTDNFIAAMTKAQAGQLPLPPGPAPSP